MHGDWRHWVLVVYAKLEQRPPIWYAMQLKSNNSGLILINRTTLFTFFAKAIKFSTNHILLLKLMSSCFLVPFIGMSQRYIATVTGRGYKWVGCVIGPGIPSASLNSSNCQPCSFMDVDRFISKSFTLMQSQSQIILFQFLLASFLAIKQDLWDNPWNKKTSLNWICILFSMPVL